MLSFRGYSFGYYPNHKWELTCEFAPGQIYEIIGENGSGKSTVLRAIAGILSPTSGAAHLNGSPLAGLSNIGRSKTFLYVPQQPEWIFAGHTFLDHLQWLARRLAVPINPRSVLERLGEWQRILNLCQRQFSDIESDDLYLLALLEDYLLQRAVLLLDECPTFELADQQRFLGAMMYRRSLKRQTTIIARHMPFRIMAGKETVVMAVEQFRLPRQSKAEATAS
jgi:ABC-type cobalamin/Fe3+-siderophores transport system ATPase subunit